MVPCISDQGMSGLCKDMPILPSAACGSARGSRQQADWHCAASETDLTGHVIVAGYERQGRAVTKILGAAHFP
jgi:hypothetical protein